ncbi:MAG: hypothetical protein IT452_05195 [Planctomycetia bacterium]|nr:hypothetical protein [Planctomycetia bacterium]
MDASEFRTAYAEWSDDDLIGILDKAGDRLPGDAVTEIALRPEAMQPRIREILTDRASWAQAGQSSWAAIHAFHLFADFHQPDQEYELRNRWPPLETAIRYLLAYDLDQTLLADFPLVVSAQGPWVWDRLTALALDRDREPRERRHYFLALGDAAKRHGGHEEDYLPGLRKVAADPAEPVALRATAARRLLDWVRPHDRVLLEKVAVDVAAATPVPELLPEEVAEAYLREEPDLTPYIRNWQAFHYREPGIGADLESAAPDLPLPSWREEEVGRVLRTCEAHLNHSEAGRGTCDIARYLLDTLVNLRLAPVRLWRCLDLEGAIERVTRKPSEVSDSVRGEFVVGVLEFLRILDARELIERDDALRMQAWLRRREHYVRKLLAMPDPNSRA